MKKHHIPLVILGAGPCGLGAAWKLHQCGIRTFQLFEASGHVGGLAASIIQNGYTWDIGGHVLHSTNQDFLRVVKKTMGNHLRMHRRNASVYVKDGVNVRYPFQYHLDQLPDGMLGRYGEAKSPKRYPDGTFARWIIDTYGAGAAKAFFFPYNQKLWKYPLRRMSDTWLEHRIAHPKDSEKKSKWGGNATFYTTDAGGIGAVWEKMAKPYKQYISFHKKVVAIQAKTRTLVFSDKTSVTYDHLLSTIPLTDFSSMIEDIRVPSSAGLKSIGTAIVGVGVRGMMPEKIKQLHWMYVADAALPFYRVSAYSHYAKTNAPSGTWSLLCETSFRGFPKSRKQYIDATIAGLLGMGIITKENVVETFFYLAPFTYPIPTLAREKTLSALTVFFSKYGISSRGRFGGWRYEEGNMDHAWQAGVDWATSIIS